MCSNCPGDDGRGRAVRAIQEDPDWAAWAAQMDSADYADTDQGEDYDGDAG